MEWEAPVSWGQRVQWKRDWGLKKSPAVELETLQQIIRSNREAVIAQRWRVWLRPLGIVTRIVVYVSLLFFWYTFRLDDISQIPLARLTLETIIRTVFWAGIGLSLLYFLCTPSDDDEIRDAWGWFGVFLFFAGVLAVALALGPEAQLLGLEKLLPFDLFDLEKVTSSEKR